MSEFKRNLAIVIGINKYSHGIPPLQAAVNDVTRLAEILEQEHGYTVRLLVNDDATKERLTRLLSEHLPNDIGTDDRLLFYFAGHGIALDGDDGPAGYVIPQDARLADRSTFLPMQALHDALTALPCRHLLAIFDCCFAGAFHWSSTRDLSHLPKVIHKERYDRFIRDRAWQVLTSADYDQKALDWLSGDIFGERGMAQQHSPFARALFEALQGAGDLVPAGGGDGVITATELYLYLRDHVEVVSEAQGKRQTPELWPLPKHDKGEYIFLTPGHPLNLPPAPELTFDNNPYRGLASFEQEHAALFYGRSELITTLADKITSQPLTVVLGASGTGKSSLVKAGVIPNLQDSKSQTWVIVAKQEAAERSSISAPVVRFMRPGKTPLTELLHLLRANQLVTSITPSLKQQFWDDPQILAQKIETWRQTYPGKLLLLLIDQFEEVLTFCRRDQERDQFLRLLAEAVQRQSEVFRLVLTLRSDFEPPIAESALKPYWRASRFVVPPMSQAELREAIEGPASERVLYFAPPELVDKIINEVVQMPGALPLLSFTLSELYLKYVTSPRREQDRALTKEDYDQLGGVIGSLRKRANDEYDNLDDLAHRATMRRVMLRMVVSEGGELMRRRVPRSELEYPDAQENTRVKEVLSRLTDARLIVWGSVEAEDGEQHAVVEPAHDALVRAWDKLLAWRKEEEEYLALQGSVNRAANEWHDAQDALKAKQKGLLWDGDPRLPQVEQIVMGTVLRSVEQEQERFKLVARGKQLISTSLKSLRNIFWPAPITPKKLTWLNKIETDFVLASIKEHRERRRRRIGTVTIVMIALIALTIFALISRNQAEMRRQEADRRARVSLAQLLATQAQSVLERYPQRSLLLGIEAMNTTLKAGEPCVVAAEQAIRDALAQSGGRGLPGGGTAAFSPDGRWLVTGSLDGTVRVWDLHAQDVAASAVALRGHEGAISAVAISPDSRWLVTGSGVGTARVWDLHAADVAASVVALRGHEGAISAVVISPDGRWLITGSWDNTARVWDLHTPDVAASAVVLQGHEGAISAVAISPDSRWLVTGSDDRTARVWDLHAADVAASAVVLRGHGGAIRAVAISPDGRWLVTGSSDNTARVWDLHAADVDKRAVVLREHEDSISAVAISPDGRWLITGSWDGTARMWDLHAADVAARAIALRGHEGAIRAVAISSDGHWLVTGSTNGTARVWDLHAVDVATSAVALHGHEDIIRAVAISPDGRWLATGSQDNTTRVWNLHAADVVASAVALRGHKDRVTAVAISPDGRWLVTGSWDNTARVWDLNAPDVAASAVALHGHEYWITAVAISPDGRWLVTGSTNGTVRVWDLQAANVAASTVVLSGHKHWIRAVAISPDGRWLVTGSEDCTVRMWDLHATDVAADAVVLSGHDNWITAVAISPDGRWLVTGSQDSTAQVWDLQPLNMAASAVVLSKVVLRGVVLRGHEGAIYTVAISPDGRWLVTGSEDHTARVWDLQAADVAASAVDLSGHKDGITALAISPDGRWLVTGSGDDTAQVWDLHAPDVAASAVVLRGHEGAIYAVAISPDGRWLVTGSTDRTARVWDLRAADVAASAVVLRGHESDITAVAISPDGRWLVSGSDDSTARVWPLQLDDLLALACQTVGRNFTYEEWEQYFHGEPYRRSCPALPVHASILKEAQ